MGKKVFPTLFDRQDDGSEALSEGRIQTSASGGTYVRSESRLRQSWKFLGVEFAPVMIPFERRLQSLAVFYWMSTFLFMASVFTFVMVYLFFHTQYAFVPVLYVTWMIYDWNTPFKGGRKNTWVRGWRLWRHFRNFFPIQLIKTAELDPTRSYLFGSHPHGVLCAGAFCSFGTDALGFHELFPGLTSRLLTLRGQFWFPGYRELFLSTGSCAATKEAMESLLKVPEGQATVLVVGGAPEALNRHEDKIKLVLNRRKGFIKLAIRFGVDLVPTFSFGENYIYGQVANPEGSMLRRLQDWTETWAGFAPVFFFGRGMFQYNWGILPYRKPINVVVGKPIAVTKNENPTREEIETLHARYVEELERLYEEYNPIYGDAKVRLEVA